MNVSAEICENLKIYLRACSDTAFEKQSLCGDRERRRSLAEEWVSSLILCCWSLQNKSDPLLGPLWWSQSMHWMICWVMWHVSRGSQKASCVCLCVCVCCLALSRTRSLVTLCVLEPDDVWQEDYSSQHADGCPQTHVGGNGYWILLTMMKKILPFSFSNLLQDGLRETHGHFGA